MKEKIFIKDEEVVIGIIFSMLKQDFIPKEVIKNWRRQKYAVGIGMNFDYEIKLFISSLIKRGIVNA